MSVSVVVAVAVVLALAAASGVPAGAAPVAGRAGSVVVAPQVTGTVGGDDLIVENPLGTDPGEEVGASAAEDRKIWAVVGGLVAVAVALTLLTVRYWRQTRPIGSGTAAPAGRSRRRRGAAGKPAPATENPDPDRATARPTARASGDDDLDLDDLFIGE